MMENELRILIAEDMPADAELVEDELRGAGIVFQSRCVDTEEDFLSELEDFSPDIVLSDYSMPNFTGMEALKLVKAHYPAIPLIIITGSANEEVAVECMKAGAADYMIKRHLSRLPLAVTGALEQKRIRDEKAKVEEERERLATAIEHTGEAIVVTDAKGVIQYVNPAFETITGFQSSEAVGQSPRILKSGKHDQAFYKQMWDAITSGKVWSGHFINKKKDGSLYEEDASISPVYDSSGRIVNYVAVKRDITERKQAEEEKKKIEAQLRQAQKMEAIGQLAGGIAHDFNNILQVILAHASFALHDLEPSSQRRKDIEKIQDAGEKAGRLIRQLLVFGRRQIIEPSVLDLNQVVEELAKMLRRVIGENIALDFIPGHRLGFIHADPTQIEQVLMNLCVNSRDAMPEGGKLTIETENVLINSAYKKTHPWAKPGRYILLSVTDSGCGMDRETLSRVFEPFFTTKEMGEGTGLGLATTYGIVKQHDGMIHVYSEPGKGTTFKIYLPLVEQQAATVGDKLEEAAGGGTETLLVVEDDQDIREAVMRMLNNVGYTVLVAQDGLAGLKVFKAHQDEIDLILLDIVMPQLGGEKLSDKIKSIKPDLPVLFSSGYSANGLHSQFVLDQDMELIKKPYEPEDLLRKIRKMLNAQ